MKDDVAKNKWFQWTNKGITHLQTTNDEDNSGNDDASVASDAVLNVASARDGRSAEKLDGVYYKFVTLDQKLKLVKMHMVME